MTGRKFIFSLAAMVAVIGFVASTDSAYGVKCGAKSTVTGKIKSVKDGTLVLTTIKCGEAKDVTMKVCPKAKITINGKTATLADLKAGTTAQVSQVTTKSGDLAAVAITVGTAKKKGG